MLLRWRCSRSGTLLSRLFRRRHRRRRLRFCVHPFNLRTPSQTRSGVSFLSLPCFSIHASPVLVLISCRRLNSIQFAGGQWPHCQANRQTDRRRARGVDVALRRTTRVSDISCDSEAVSLPPSLPLLLAGCPFHSASHSRPPLPFLATIHYNGRQTETDRQARRPLARSHGEMLLSPLSPLQHLLSLSKHVRRGDSGGGGGGGGGGESRGRAAILIDCGACGQRIRNRRGGGRPGGARKGEDVELRRKGEGVRQCTRARRRRGRRRHG